MKKLLAMSLTILLSGCVTYYYPETALDNGVYYAEDDPAYVIDSSGYVDSSYYPWSSMDYFYLDYYSAPRYSYYGGFSFGFSYAYSPWYPPYYGYPHHYAWRPYHGHGHGYRGYRGYGYKGYGNRYSKGKKRRNNSDYRYADNGRNGNNDRDRNGDRDNRRGRNETDLRNPSGSRGGRSSVRGESAAPAQRYVSTTPSGYSGDTGMQVRSGGSKSSGKSTKQPVRRDQPDNLNFSPSTKSVSTNSYTSRRATGSASEIRSRAGSKQGGSRIEPVRPGKNSRSVVVNSTGSRSGSSTGTVSRNQRSTNVKASSSASSTAVASRAPTSARRSSGASKSTTSRGSRRSQSSASSSGRNSQSSGTPPARKKSRK